MRPNVRFHGRAETHVGVFLSAQHGEERFRGRRRIDGHPARLVVAEDDDERLARMLPVKVIRDAHGVVERDRLPDSRRRVVRVAGEVDLSPFDHQEEALRIVEKFDSLGRESGKRYAVIRAVDVEGRRAQDGEDAAGRGVQPVEFLPRRSHAIPGVADRAERVGAVLFRSRRPPESASGEVIDAASGDLERDVVVGAPRDGMRVEGRGRRVVERDGGHDADLHPGGPRELRDGRKR